MKQAIHERERLRTRTLYTALFSDRHSPFYGTGQQAAITHTLALMEPHEARAIVQRADHGAEILLRHRLGEL